MDNEESDQDFEAQYTPSKWTSSDRANLTSQQVLQDYFDKLAQGTESIFHTYTHSSLSYGPSPCEEILLISPDTSDTTTSPNAGSNGNTQATSDSAGSKVMLLYIHGGYWQEGYYRNDSIHLARPVLEAGYEYAAFGYLDKSSQPNMPELVSRVVSGLNKLCEHLTELKYESLVLSGHSAGAHLVAMAMLSQQMNSNSIKLIKGVVLMSGVYDITPLLHTSILIPELEVPNRETACSMSPSFIMNKEDKPVVLTNLRHNLVVCGADESQAFRSQSISMSKLMNTKGLENRRIEVEKRDHFNLITELHHPTDHLAKEILTLLNDVKNSAS